MPLATLGKVDTSGKKEESMTDIPSKHECRKCGNPIFWHKSTRTGKHYPCDSPTDRKAFHQCVGPAAQKPAPKVEAKPITPDYFEATLEQRVESLEKQVTALTRTLRAVEARQPITSSDVGF